jgi:hypothetical protein
MELISALAPLLQSFLVIGHEPGQVLMLKAGPSSGDINTYQIQRFPGGEEPALGFQSTQQMG